MSNHVCMCESNGIKMLTSLHDSYVYFVRYIMWSHVWSVSYVHARFSDLSRCSSVHLTVWMQQVHYSGTQKKLVDVFSWLYKKYIVWSIAMGHFGHIGLAGIGMHFCLICIQWPDSAKWPLSWPNNLVYWLVWTHI